jgi:hypothetical protein
VISTAFRRVMHYKVLKYMILDCNFNKKQKKKPMYKMFAKKTKFFFLKLGPQIPRDTGRKCSSHVTRLKDFLAV